MENEQIHSVLEVDKSEMTYIPGGSFLMGTEDSEGFAADGETPIHTVELSSFYIDTCAVTNKQFMQFINEISTNYYKVGDSHNPQGPKQGEQRTMRGGSYLCHKSYCNRYRVAARSKNTPDSSTGNIGIRYVIDA